MAKKSAIAKNKRRQKMAKKFASKRARLKAIQMDKDASMEERFDATLKLADLPPNSAPIRVRNRCAITGRPRAHHRKFRLCRNKLRELALHGQLPGVTKSSW